MRGDDAAAQCGLERAVTQLDATGSKLFAAAARRRLGGLLGGDEGASIEAEGAAMMRAEGATDVEALTRLFAPATGR